MSEHPDWYRTGRGHVWLPYTQMQTARAPLPVVSAQGVRLTLADGRELVDGISSWWACVHGYRHPHIETAVRQQLETLPHVMLGGLAHEQAYVLARRLAALLPGDLNHVFFSDSGSVAVEVAMKMAAQFWLNRGQRRVKFLCFRGGYHGDTFATMSVCDPDEGMHSLFKGALLEQVVVDLPRDAAGEAALGEVLAQHRGELAGIVVEPLVQGAGGMVFHEAFTLQALRRLADEHDLLLIFDEIFVGLGRLGDAMFACQIAGVQPDIVTLSKALTGGTLPLAATIASTRIHDGFLSDDPLHALMHGPTYMGNALGCAAANASLDLFESEPRLAQARAIGARLEHLLSPLRGLPGVKDVRMRGAIGVVQLDRPAPADQLSAACIARGVWLRPFRDILYTTPPLTISEEDLAQVGTAMVAAISRWSQNLSRS
ncbi:MAG: adenosylmethionine--8-amino-7-oxononanoate transaminase [Novosphingobium sp. 28-62-57]|uniref:adenosylmethionine--8-amino-7-oxononanoate transaminase n=1 Tax=unclassified Novosphingobium TaxID=2644732 RepID=UPI000BD321B0|nr:MULTISPECIES: adenosylmethionine--8-amino-7-oxononanoate transaminase [unclassified Novosphingobium]OYW49387.1 MAG: adenosylmethionine--8-amino-7-oxononanoate transaminase [Novosphingobium sp. 12-62-10]OYZ09140.1 MAG: adenosylmethionine--8-amino-7-oxononanoate transaminase [Novosphingobium sp. 28-62-57]OZA30224.1 MAG: adenosylmethionine--8-amino-7-oxononanoate transaminase [Novosphingobium sp. 17-62-9]HQS68363.1 adenosylmethionine--8-amino-7-oxononanoate transaminase [Novosphingobium sp.]